MWKIARIIPLLKPGKPADKGSSFCPIYILSPLAKIRSMSTTNNLKTPQN